MICRNCGAITNDASARVCPGCGVPFSKETFEGANENRSNAWPEWIIEKILGKGSFGTVYKAVRRDNNVESFSAIKVIRIPADSSEIDSLRSEGLDENSARTYYQGIVNEFTNEIQLMQSLKGIQNIVSVEDYKVIEEKDVMRWLIYIRMELLTPFNQYIIGKKLNQEDVIKLGCDICTALIMCGKKKVIHRDIKPENIFVNEFGDFKLGDFGIARKLENATGNLSQKGTFNYMAPEVANSKHYDARADIYSLGIVLYRLMNENRLPFLENESQLMNPNERKRAAERRIMGEALNPPCSASPEMAEVILRACAYDPDNRFQTAAEMKSALNAVLNGSYMLSDAVATEEGTVHVRKAPIDPNAKANTDGKPFNGENVAPNQAQPYHNFMDNTPSKNNNFDQRSPVTPQQNGYAQVVKPNPQVYSSPQNRPGPQKAPGAQGGFTPVIGQVPQRGPVIQNVPAARGGFTPVKGRIPQNGPVIQNGRAAQGGFTPVRGQVPQNRPAVQNGPASQNGFVNAGYSVSGNGYMPPNNSTPISNYPPQNHSEPINPPTEKKKSVPRLPFLIPSIITLIFGLIYAFDEETANFLIPGGYFLSTLLLIIMAFSSKDKPCILGMKRGIRKPVFVLILLLLIVLFFGIGFLLQEFELYY